MKFKKLLIKLHAQLTCNKGGSELVAVVGVMIVVLVLLAVVFMPQMKTYFETVVMPSIETTTQKLFNFS